MRYFHFSKNDASFYAFLKVSSSKLLEDTSGSNISSRRIMIRRFFWHEIKRNLLSAPLKVSSLRHLKNTSAKKSSFRLTDYYFNEIIILMINWKIWLDMNLHFSQILFGQRDICFQKLTPLRNFLLCTALF